MGRISDLIKVSPGFKAAVNIVDDFSNELKVAAYLPTAFGRQILDAIARSLDVVMTDRARIIHGNFGTGKSHLALVLAHFFANRWGHPALAPVFDKIKVKDHDLYDRLLKARSGIPQPFLVVRLVAQRGSIAEGLLTGLDHALQAEGLGSLMPETMFHAAIKRLEEVETHYTASKAALEQAVLADNLISVHALKTNLGKFRPDALDAFRKIHPQFSAGATFNPHHDQKPYAVYKAVTKALVETGKFGGIFVVWDEFGENLRQLMTESHRKEYLDLQDFAEACAGSRDFPLHFLGLTHQSLGELIATATTLTKAVTDDLNKMAGRFTQWPVRVQDGEIYRLMDEIIIPADPGQATSYLNTNRNWLEGWADQASTLKLFPTLSSKDVLEVIGEGCYPMHPAAAFCLPELSEKVAQNERTLFYFLSAVGPGTLSDYLSSTLLPDAKGVPPVFTVDALWDYFAPLIKADSRRIGTGRTWHQFEQAPKSLDPMANRVLRVIALLHVINHERLRPIEETIAFCLGAAGSAKDEISDILSELSTGAAKALTFSRHSKEYSFVAGSGQVDLEEEIRQATATRMGLLAPISYIQKMKRVGLMESIEPTDHNDTHQINREFGVRVLTVKELEESDLKEKGPAAAPADGTALLVLAGDHAEVDRARTAATTFSNPRLLIAVPKEPVNYEAIVRRLDALEHIRKEKPEIFGEGKPQYNDWQDALDDEVKQLVRELEKKLTPSDEGPDWFWRGKAHSTITGMPRLKRLASAAADDAFSKTVRISHDKLMDDSWDRDQQAKYRKAAVNYLFRPGTGPKEAASVENSAEKKVITAAWRGTDYLRNVNGDWTVGRPPGATTAAEVWDLIEAYLKEARNEDKDFSVLITQLRNPPYGLRNRVLPLLLAAVMQPHLSNLIVTRSAGGAKVTLDGDVVEMIVQAPKQFKVRYVELSEREESILTAFEEAFIVEQSGDVASRVTAVKSAVSAWTAGLSRYAQGTSSLGSSARAILNKVLLPLGQVEDAWAVITKEFPAQLGIPHLIGATQEQLAQAGKTLHDVKVAFDNGLAGLESRVLAVIVKELGHAGHTAVSVSTVVSTWYAKLPQGAQAYPFGGDSAKLLAWAKSITSEATIQQILAIAEALIGEPLCDWTDATVSKLEGKLESAANNIVSFNPPAHTAAGAEPPRENPPTTLSPTVAGPEERGKAESKTAPATKAASADPAHPASIHPETRINGARENDHENGATRAKDVSVVTTRTAGGGPETSTIAPGTTGVHTQREAPRKASVKIMINGQSVTPIAGDLDVSLQGLLDSLQEVLALKASALGNENVAAVILRLLEEKVSS